MRTGFEEFGNPHPMDENGFATDTTFGKFRIGRGQMFAFGVNTWRSANFLMVTDVDNWGLEYDYREDQPHQPGCIVEIALYDHLSLRDIQHTVDELTRFCRYVAVNLVVNGQRISEDPATLEWDVVNDLAYIKKKVVEHRWRPGAGLDVYQQGVFVENIPPAEFGVSGTIVIRQEVDVNFARNQVKRRCPRWKKVVALLKEEGIKDSIKKKKLNRSEARNFVEEFAGGDGSISYDAFWTTACLPDVTGKLWSPKNLYQLIHTRSDSPRIERDPDGCILVGFAPHGNDEAEKVMQMKRAVVLDNIIMEWMQLDHIAEEEKRGKAALRQLGNDALNAREAYDRFAGKLIWADYTTLLEDLDTRDYTRLSPDKYSPRERDFIRCMDDVVRTLDYTVNGYQNRQNRQLCMCETELGDAWTDGSKFIAFSRKYVAGLNLSMERDWFKAGLVIADMFSFTCDSSESGNVRESVEFLQDYLEYTKVLPNTCRWAYQVFIGIMQRRGTKLPKKAQEEIIRAAEAYAHEMVVYREDESAEPTGDSLPAHGNN